MVLIAVCTLIFYQMGLTQIDFNNFVRTYGITPVKLLNNINNQWFTIISSMFVHGNLSHLLGNMVYLWIFGDNIEDSFGKVRFIIFYILCGFAAVFSQILMIQIARTNDWRKWSNSRCFRSLFNNVSKGKNLGIYVDSFIVMINNCTCIYCS